MSSIVLFKQLMVLLALMITGFIAYKTDIVDDHTYSHLSTFMVWILNPFLVISGVIGKNLDISKEILIQNVIMVTMLFVAFFLIGFAYITILGIKGNESYLYRMMILFPNAGFMGIPLVREIFGPQYIVLVAFYMLGFNLISYSYGIHLASRYGGNREKFNPKNLIQPGTITALIAIVIFSLQIELPQPVVSYIDFMGNTCITLSMIIIGVALGQMNWKEAFAKKDYYIFTLTRMFIIPIIMILVGKCLHFNPYVFGVFEIMCCMPVASMCCMFTKEYAGDGNEAAKVIAITTVLTVVSAPIVVLLVG